VPILLVNLSSLRRLVCYPYGSYSFARKKRFNIRFKIWRVKEDNYYSSVAPTKSLIIWSIILISINILSGIKLSRVFLSFIFIQASSPESKFLDKLKRQEWPRLSFHSSLQLKGEWLCYLCTVRIPRPLNIKSLGRMYLIL